MNTKRRILTPETRLRWEDRWPESNGGWADTETWADLLEDFRSHNFGAAEIARIKEDLETTGEAKYDIEDEQEDGYDRDGYAVLHSVTYPILLRFEEDEEEADA